MNRDWLLLTPLARSGDAGLLARLVTGAFLVWQNHDNIFSAARMDELDAWIEGRNDRDKAEAAGAR